MTLDRVNTFEPAYATSLAKPPSNDQSMGLYLKGRFTDYGDKRFVE